MTIQYVTNWFYLPCPGRVLDGTLEDSKPLAGAAVFINGQKVAETGLEGAFELTNVTAGYFHNLLSRYLFDSKFSFFYISNVV